MLESIKESQGSIYKGIWFVFNDNENTIKVWVSGTSGKEKVYLNDTLVSEKRNLKMNSQHTFSDSNQTNYEVKTINTNIMKGVLECHLNKIGDIIKKYECRFDLKGFVNTKSLITLIGGAIIIGVLKGLGYISELTMIILLIILITFNFIVFKPKKYLIKEI